MSEQIAPIETVPEEKLPRWMVDTLRKASAEALAHMTDVLRDLEGNGDWIGKEDRYPRMLKAISLLTAAMAEVCDCG
jgi:hypothetical protein